MDCQLKKSDCLYGKTSSGTNRHEMLLQKEAQLPSVSLQQGFKIMTGYSLGEYIRFRRLYLAALDIMAGQNRVIDLALKYGYETPESFSKAFRRFHGVSPSQLSGNRNNITHLPSL